MCTYTHMYTHIYMKARDTTFRCLKGKKKKGVLFKKKKKVPHLFLKEGVI